MSDPTPAPSRIRVLDPDLVNQIAAGEVVERPASVVKELLENALDAEATRVEIALRGSGIDEIRIQDDGCGMTRDEARLALVRHATSKLACEADLRRIATFGFRGEALPAIAAVSRLRLLTRRPDDPEGTEVLAEDGAEPIVKPAGAPPGTTLVVRDLFYRTPARRKFLKSPRTELAGCVRTVEWLALSHPGVAFHLLHDDRPLRRFLSQRTLAERVHEVLPELDLHEIAGTREGLGVLAFLAPPEQAKPGGRGLEILVNGRRVQDRSVVAALLGAHEGLLPRGVVPSGVLVLNLDPDQVDVNVHPRKEEVRFSNPRQIHSALFHLLREGIAAAPWGRPRPGFAPPVPYDLLPPRPPWTAPPPAPPRLDPALGSLAVDALPPRPLEPPAEASPWAPGTAPSAPASPGGFFGTLEPAGQVFLTYLLCEGSGRLVIIDQHAAHERVVYEDLRRALAGGRVASQGLLEPLPVPLAPELLALLDDERGTLERLGFEADPFGADRALLRAHPAGLRIDAAAALRETLASLRHGRGAERSAVDRGLETVACHSAIRAGKRVSDAEVRALLRRMDEVDFGSWCPHGRPAWTAITRADLERMFGRR